MRIGYQLLVELLTELGLDMVFGIPGSESVEVFDELRRKKIRTVLANSEREAAFMAIGHYAASGRVAGLCTIGGPGFTNTLSGVAEAREDSAAMLYLLICRDASPRSYGLHAIDHRAIAAPLAKAFYTVREASGLAQAVRAAHAEAISGEPGPVVVELMRQAVIGYADPLGGTDVHSNPPRVESGKLENRLRESKRPVLFVGQGALDASKPLTDLAEVLQCPVLSTGSGRGVVPDRHPLCMGTPFGQERPSEVIETILRDADLVIALGCKFSHNGSYGHRLPLRMEQLARVDASRKVIEANYPASISLVADVPAVVERLRQAMEGTAPKQWGADTLRTLRAQVDAAHDLLGNRDSNLRTPAGHSPATVFAMLREALPDDARVVTDSGLHQFLTRTHFEVRQPRTLLFPTDFQSMGYGLPAAAGAQLATPERTTVAVVGDGGFAMTALELATAKRERIPIKVLVFNNGTLELIRESQIKKRGAEHAIRLLIPDLEIFAASLDLPFARWDDLNTGSLRELLEMATPVLIEVRMTGNRSSLRSKATGHVRAIIEPHLGPAIAESIWQRRRRRN